MKTITLNSGQTYTDKLHAEQLAEQLIRCGAPFHYYVTAGGYPRFRFTFDLDFRTAWAYMTSRAHKDTFQEGKEEP